MQTRRLAAVAAVVASGCSVPSVTFYSDASIDGNEDAVVDAGGDGDASNDTTALVDASDAGSEADSPACPIAPPPGATACCGAVACAGDCPDACAAWCFEVHGHAAVLRPRAERDLPRARDELPIALVTPSLELFSRDGNIARLSQVVALTTCLVRGLFHAAMQKKLFVERVRNYVGGQWKAVGQPRARRHHQPRHGRAARLRPDGRGQRRRRRGQGREGRLPGLARARRRRRARRYLFDLRNLMEKHYDELLAHLHAGARQDARGEQGRRAARHRQRRDRVRACRRS